ncbi:hypothetical protein D3C72_1380400 [compost metagenome]
MGIVDERTQSIMDALGIARASGAASGRYLRSDPLRPGVRYWAGHAHGQALFGVQFLADAMDEAGRLGHALEAAGFLSREPAPKLLTYCRGSALLADGELDVDALRVAKVDLDRILS